MYKYANGDIYEGRFFENINQGYGVFKWTNGSRYEGEWSNNKQHGKGKMYYYDGDIYDGQWSNNMKDGYGIYTYSNASKIAQFGKQYKGYFRNDIKSAR